MRLERDDGQRLVRSCHVECVDQMGMAQMDPIEIAKCRNRTSRFLGDGAPVGVKMRPHVRAAGSGR
ncbi:hypothetical protein AA0472_3043 [Acetobacter estunensis NRIC 0472]|nr:hypothetical protein AA0472_3043 [Acetobacter estunensis NRIC 0472]